MPRPKVNPIKDMALMGNSTPIKGGNSAKRLKFWRKNPLQRILRRIPKEPKEILPK